MRAVIFWLHLVLGCVFGVVIAVVSATGAMLGFQAQMVDGAENVAVVDAPRLTVDDVVKRASEGRKGRVTSITVKTDPAAAIAVGFAGEEGTFVDPRTGALSRPSARRRFLDGVEDVHRSLTVGKIGKAVVGVSTLGFFVIALSGVILWLPRRWSRKNVRAVAWFKRGLDGKARDFNWHNTIGLWSLVVILAVCGSGVVITFGWASDLVYRAAGEKPPSPSGPLTVARGETPTLPLEALFARARVEAPEAATYVMRMPPPPAKADGAKPPAATIIARVSDPLASRTLTLDPFTGAVLKDETPASRSRGQRARVFMRFLHTGQVFGVVGQTLATVASLGAVVLVWTGLALVWRRFLGWMRRRRATN